jgi:phosphatidate phosphatase APP1
MYAINQNSTNKLGAPKTVRKGWTEKLFHLFRLTRVPTVKVYRGYGHAGHITVYGQVFHQSALPRKKYRQNLWTNTFALLRLFMVHPYPNATVRLKWNEQVLEATSEKDGFFRIEWDPSDHPVPGWHNIEIELLGHLYKDGTGIKSTGHVFIPYETQYGFISDIDDTFLISHSSNLRKRLFVLFTENARSRDPFEGVVKHYQLLSAAGTKPEAPNPFFYVSSSEWNLYDYIVEFCRDNEMPQGVLLLSQLKLFKELFKTGQNKHKTKFARAVRILEAFPKQRFVLLGDDTQEDPNIYQAVVEHFPQQIVCVYIRQVLKNKKDLAINALALIEKKGVPVCYFNHSKDAILHSIRIGLIPQQAITEI